MATDPFADAQTELERSRRELTVATDPFADAHTELERGRRERLTVIAVIVLALVATVVVVTLGPGQESAVAAVAAGALVIAVAAEVGSLVERERRSVRATRTLAAARAAHAAQEARERTLGALHAATRSVSASLELTDVVERGVLAATALVGGARAVLWLRVEDTLAVAAATGAGTPSLGGTRALGPVDRAVLGQGATVCRDGDGGPPALTAPLALPDRVVGVLEVQRDPDADAFGEHDRLALTLLAEHVALALRNATDHDRERQRAASFRSLVGVTSRDLGGAPDGRAERISRPRR